MSGNEKLQFDHAQTLYILDLELKNVFYENFYWQSLMRKI